MLTASPCSSTSKPLAAQDGCELGRPVVDDDDQPLRVAAKLAQAPRPHDRAAAEDHHRVADPLCLLEMMGRDHDVHPELAPDPPDQGEHVVALERVEPVGRLVEEHELRIVDDRSRELHALPLAGRHRADRTEALLAEAHLPERVVRALDRRPGGQAVQLAEMPDEIGGVHVRRQVVVLGRVADAGAHVDAGARRDRARGRSARRRRASGGRARAR